MWPSPTTMTGLPFSARYLSIFPCPDIWSSMVYVLQGHVKPEELIQGNLFQMEAIISNMFHVASQEGMYCISFVLQSLMIIRYRIPAKKEVGFLQLKMDGRVVTVHK